MFLKYENSSENGWRREVLTFALPVAKSSWSLGIEGCFPAFFERGDVSVKTNVRFRQDVRSS